MKPSELFGVVIRSIGLLLILAAIPGACMGILSLVLGGPAGPIFMGVCAIPMLLVGIWFIRGASGLAESVYSEKARKDE